MALAGSRARTDAFLVFLLIGKGYMALAGSRARTDAFLVFLLIW
jgi:hypothetical protein